MWQFLIHRRKGSLPIAVGNLALFSFRGKLSHCMFNLIDAIKVLRFAQVPKFFHPSHHCARRFPISLRRNAANYRGLLRTDATTGPIHFSTLITLQKMAAMSHRKNGVVAAAVLNSRILHHSNLFAGCGTLIQPDIWAVQFQHFV